MFPGTPVRPGRRKGCSSGALSTAEWEPPPPSAAATPWLEAIASVIFVEKSEGCLGSGKQRSPGSHTVPARWRLLEAHCPSPSFLSLCSAPPAPAPSHGSLSGPFRCWPYHISYLAARVSQRACTKCDWQRPSGCSTLLLEGVTKAPQAGGGGGDRDGTSWREGGRVGVNELENPTGARVFPHILCPRKQGGSCQRP